MYQIQYFNNPQIWLDWYILGLDLHKKRDAASPQHLSFYFVNVTPSPHGKPRCCIRYGHPARWLSLLNCLLYVPDEGTQPQLGTFKIKCMECLKHRLHFIVGSHGDYRLGE